MANGPPRKETVLSRCTDRSDLKYLVLSCLADGREKASDVIRRELDWDRTIVAIDAMLRKLHKKGWIERHEITRSAGQFRGRRTAHLIVSARITDAGRQALREKLDWWALIGRRAAKSKLPSLSEVKQPIGGAVRRRIELPAGGRLRDRRPTKAEKSKALCAAHLDVSLLIRGCDLMPFDDLRRMNVGSIDQKCMRIDFDGRPSEAISGERRPFFLEAIERRNQDSLLRTSKGKSWTYANFAAQFEKLRAKARVSGSVAPQQAGHFGKRHPTDDERRRMLEACAGDPMNLLLRLLWSQPKTTDDHTFHFTFDDARGLTISSVNLETKSLRVKRMPRAVDVRLPGELESVINELINLHSSGPLLKDPLGQRWDYGRAFKRWAALRTALGLPGEVKLLGRGQPRAATVSRQPEPLQRESPRPAETVPRENPIAESDRVRRFL